MSEGGLTVSQIDAEAPEAREWEAYALAHRAGTVYHRLAWTRIFAAGMRYRSFLLLARSGGAMAGVLPLYLVPGLGGRRLVAVPFRDRGGPLYDNVNVLRELIAAADRIANQERASTVLLKSLEPLPAEGLGPLGYTEHRHWIHSAVDLSGMSTEAMWKQVGDKTRNMVRQAERRGLAFADLTSDASALSIWYALHLETQRRLGVPPFPRAFFSTMLATLTSADAMRVFAVRDGGAAVSATLVLLERDRAIYAYSASNEAGRSGRANDLMLHGMLRFAIDRGLRWMDLGSDSPRQESLLFFKRRWLARQDTIPTYSRGKYRPEGLDSSSAAFRVARAAVSRLPRFLFRRLAPIARVFG